MPRKGQKGGKNPGAFPKGHKLSVGNRGPRNPNFLTQTLVSMLNEVDKNTSKPKLYEVCEVLLKCAVGGVIYYKAKDEVATSETYGKVVTRELIVAPEGWAMKELWDRVQGKAIQMVAVDPDNNMFTLVFDKEDADA